MKKILFTIMLATGTCFSGFAQATIDISSEYDIPGGRVKDEYLPTYYAEDGVVKFTFSGTDSWGYPDSLAVDYIDSSTPLRGSIKYFYHKLNSEERDSLKTEATAAIAQNTETLLRVSVKPYFKLYPTENMWTFIELNTVTGALWQVQYTVDKSEKYRFKTMLDLSDKRKGTYFPETEEPGRFELYKTQNMYNFILLDTLEGGVWQVQWSIEKDKRMALPISIGF